MLRPSIFNDNFTDSLFDDLFGDSFWKGSRLANHTGSLMNTDIKEIDGANQIEIELPGFSKEEVQAELKDGCLTIQASHQENKEDKKEEGKYLRKERYSGSCSRSFYVGEDVKQEDIKAAFADGILTITIPKKEPEPEKIPEKKMIEIQG